MKKLILILLLTIPLISISQTKDANVWTGIGVSMDLTKKLSLGYEMQTRFGDNITGLSAYLNQVGVEYELIDGLDVGLEYRFSRKKKDYYFVSENRIMFNLSYGIKIEPANLKLSVRARFQHEFDRLNIINEYILPEKENKFRVKFTLKYKNPDFKLIQPYIGYEFYNVLENVSNQFIDRNRFIGGLEFDLPKGHEIKLYYMHQTDFDNQIEINHIYSVQYGYNLDKLFKKKKKK